MARVTQNPRNQTVMAGDTIESVAVIARPRVSRSITVYQFKEQPSGGFVPYFYSNILPSAGFPSVQFEALNMIEEQFVCTIFSEIFSAIRTNTATITIDGKYIH